MKKAKRLEDINTRLRLANAERGCHEKGSIEYNDLTEVCNAILSEYGKRNTNRYGFRLINGKYRLVVLMPEEKI